MSILTKQIDKIAFPDVVDFLKQGMPESTTLDYKREMPKDLAKCISAFANTFGGMIIIGAEEADGKPKEPFLGISIERGYQERIISICVDNIFPPIVPEVAIVSQDDKSFVVIRIPQSAIAPHSIQSNTLAYIRTGNRNSPETLMTYDRHRWLSNRRELSLEYREKLLITARSRYGYLLPNDDLFRHQPTIELFCSPVYPKDPLSPTADFLILQSKTFLEYPKLNTFPTKETKLRQMDQGMYAFERAEVYYSVKYFELTQCGTAFLSRNLNWKNHSSERDDVIYISRLVGIIAHFFDTTSAIYSYLGYYGLIHFELRLIEILNTELIHFNSREIRGPRNSTESKLERTILLYPNESSTRETRDTIIAEMLSSICWALGTQISKEQLAEFIPSLRR